MLGNTPDVNVSFGEVTEKLHGNAIDIPAGARLAAAAGTALPSTS
jgi:hypothetical protein